MSSTVAFSLPLDWLGIISGLSLEDEADWISDRRMRTGSIISGAGARFRVEDATEFALVLLRRERGGGAIDVFAARSFASTLGRISINLCDSNI